MIVNNHQLFSHTYLARLQADPTHDEAAAPIGQGLRDWMPFRDTSSLRSLIDSWVGPVLDFLKFHHVLADDSPHICLLYTRRGDETPVGLCYVVPPGQDGSTGSPRGLNDTTKGQHPMAQAVLALRTRDLRWGMLTDGARWRLVDAQALRRYEHYVEVDLDELARSDDPTPLRLFYAFFHRSAFTPAHSPASGGTEGGGESGLDRLVAASIRATKAAEDHLKARVSHNEGIMAQLCLGLVRADGRTCYTDTERDAIYRDATYLLYRILFILYAEARGLLPVNNLAYRAVSLAELVKTAHDYKLRGMPDPQATMLWERLKRLCNAIYESDPVLGIPAYNGGLFDDADKPYLRDGHIADMYLTEALFDLAYMPDKVPGTSEVPGTSYRPIDYRDLSVRHMGSLYEGMIEYKLHIAEETLWARRDGKGNVRFLRSGQDGAPRKTDVEIEPGQVYFSQSPGERRATGTYYTPEYIVDYIVRQTVVRGLEERRAPLEEKLAGWLEEIAVTTDPAERARMQRTADEELLRFVKEQVLTFRVCDIGMGSGHFLVNSAHQIANSIMETLHLTPWGPVLSGVEGNDAVDADPATWRRQVVERCLYGVDLSLMAVELAKLSLWLASVAEGKPLSFLDHHLRQGNSLIGARLEDLAEVLAGVASTRPSRQERKAREAGQLSMLDDPAFSQHVTAATDLLAQISARVVERVEDIKAQEADYEQVRAELEPYRRLADLWTARHFGVDVDEQQLRAISRYLVNGAVSPVPEYERILTRTQELAHDRSFFHWELEFPTVFLDQSDQLLEDRAGFDAVVGNPPYSLDLTQQEKHYFKKTYPSLFFKINLFAAFVERGLELSRSPTGCLSLIIPNLLLGNRSLRDLRVKLATDNTIRALHNLGDGVFEEAEVPTLVFVVQKQLPLPDHEVVVGSGALTGGNLDAQRIRQSSILVTQEQVFNLSSTREIDIITRLMARCDLFQDHLDIHQGVITGDDSRFLADAPRGSHWKPTLTGKDIDRYITDYPTLYVDYQPALLAAPREIAIFDVPEKLLMRRTGDRPLASYDDRQTFNLHTLYSIRKENSSLLSLKYCLALINSSLMAWIYKTLLPTEIGRTFAEIKIVHIRQLPISRIAFTTPLNERTVLVQESVALYIAGKQEALLASVSEWLTTQPGRADVVHDLLAHLAQQMIDLNKERQRLEREANLFRFVDRDTSCVKLDEALGGPLGAGEMVGNLSAVHHNIEGLRLTQEDNGRWLLEVRAKLRDPESDWREHQRDKEGNFIRQWLPAYRLPLDKATGRFYHYAFAHLGGFAGAGKFPGGSTRTTLEKLKATKVPKLVSVDLAPLTVLDAELTEVRRKIRLTDDLIDQIVYRLYGLTEEEIAIVEGRG
ncbi:MAG: TaqI-like C-terminal specificity domain-containing protein [Anaerolineae bacterium]